MTRTENFEDIGVWKEARFLMNQIYQMSTTPVFFKDFTRRDQLRKAGNSTMANLAEGFGSQSDKAFIRYLFFSKASVSEVQSHLYVALDQQYIEKEVFDELYQQCAKIKHLLGGLIRYLNGNK